MHCDASSVQFDTLFNTRFPEVAGLLESTLKLPFGGGRRAQMIRTTVPDDQSSNAETSFAEFRCCSARPDLHVPQNGDWLGQRDSLS